jgi:hypothetical protein
MKFGHAGKKYAAVFWDSHSNQFPKLVKKFSVPDNCNASKPAQNNGQLE